METRETLQEKVLALPAADRAHLLEELIASLNTEKQSAIEKAWVIEAEERLRAYDEGKLTSISLEESKRRIASR